MEKQTLFYLFVGIFAVTAIITLLGITGVIKTIKDKYLNVLFSAVILEVAAAIFLLFNSINLDEKTVNLASVISRAGLKPPENIELHEDFIIKKLEVTPQINKLSAENTQLKNELLSKTKEIEDLKGSISRYDQNFYSNIIRLDDELYKIPGNSINLGYRPEDKGEIYKYLVNIFQDLGMIKEGDGVFRDDNSINKTMVRSIYREFRASYGRSVEDDTNVFVEASDISRMVGRYLEYRKVTPQFQARFNAINN